MMLLWSILSNIVIYNYFVFVISKSDVQDKISIIEISLSVMFPFLITNNFITKLSEQKLSKVTNITTQNFSLTIIFLAEKMPSTTLSFSKV